MRAVAAFLVVATHTSAFVDFGHVGQAVTGAGKHGVQVFFVISGYTVAVTFANSASYVSYITRRMMRIAPLYYFACAIAAVLVLYGIVEPSIWMTRYDSSLNGYNIFMHLTFLSGWDVTVANSIIGTEWTIPVEVFWYFILPFLLPFVGTKRGFFWSFTALLLLSGITRGFGGYFLPAPAEHFMPTTYGAYFLMGAACFYLRDKFCRSEWAIWISSGSAVLFVAALLIGGGLTSMLIGLATMGLIASYKPKGGYGLLEWKPLLFLGSISYSVYLWHLIVVDLIQQRAPLAKPESNLFWFLFVCLITIALSTLSYITIERPSNRLGSKVAAALQKKKLSR